MFQTALVYAVLAATFIISHCGWEWLFFITTNIACEMIASKFSIILSLTVCNSKTQKQIIKLYIFNLHFSFISLSCHCLIPSLYLSVRTPPPPQLSQSQTVLGRSPGSSSWNLRCLWSGKLDRSSEEKWINEISTSKFQHNDTNSFVLMGQNTWDWHLRLAGYLPQRQVSK